MLNLKLQYFGHLMRRADSLEKTLMLGKIEGRRRRGNPPEGRPQADEIPVVSAILLEVNSFSGFQYVFLINF